MKTASNLNRGTRQFKNKLKKVMNFISDTENHAKQEAGDVLAQIRGFIDFNHIDLDNYFNNVTVNSNRINLYKF